MSNNFKDSIKKNIIHDSKSSNDSKNESGIQKDNTNINNPLKFQLSKKKDDKTNKKVFNVYMENNLVKELDKLVKKSGYSRNELINLMCQWCINNLEFKE